MIRQPLLLSASLAILSQVIEGQQVDYSMEATTRSPCCSSVFRDPSIDSRLCLQEKWTLKWTSG